MMEEFRALVVDAVILNVCLNHQLTPKDFTLRSDGYTLHTEAARIFVRAIEMRLNTERQHPQSGDLLDMRRIMDAQVRALSTCYRKMDAGAYQACVFR
jgi:CRISPR-associated protein Cas1